MVSLKKTTTKFCIFHNSAERLQSALSEKHLPTVSVAHSLFSAASPRWHADWMMWAGLDWGCGLLWVECLQSILCLAVTYCIFLSVKRKIKDSWMSIRGGYLLKQNVIFTPVPRLRGAASSQWDNHNFWGPRWTGLLTQPLPSLTFWHSKKQTHIGPFPPHSSCRMAQFPVGLSVV